MGFFASFWSWLNAQLVTYIGTHTAQLASTLEPAVAILGSVYVMAWGYLQMTGKIDEPWQAGVRRIALLALVLGCALHLWLYNSLIVDTFYRAPAQLAAAVVGVSDPVTTIDGIWQSGGTVANNFWAKGHVYNSTFGFLVAALFVWCLMGLLCVYAMFLIALASIAQAVLLALGPLFIVALLFQPTRRLFAAWLAQLTNYALVTVITVMIGALLLQIVASYAAQTAARGSAIFTVDALDMLLVSVLVFLILRQVLPIASSLAGGVSLSTLGTLSSAMRMAVPSAQRRKEAVEALKQSYGLLRTRFEKASTT